MSYLHIQTDVPIINLENMPVMVKLQKIDTGTGLKDGLTTIQLIHARYGQLTYNQGLGFEVK